MRVNKFYRVPIVAACLLLIVTGAVFKTIKVKAASQCFPSCGDFNNWASSLCPSGSVLQNSNCSGSGWNVLCMKQIPQGTDPARCITDSVCYTIGFFNGEPIVVCNAVFGSCGPYGGGGQTHPYIYAGAGGSIGAPACAN
jgi:hypothetical protein